MAHILVVDDDPDIGIMLKLILEFKGYQVTLINRADRTLEILSNENINLVILDMLIAAENGTDVCSGIRQQSVFSKVPIMMISALPDARKVCLQAGANEFMSKPFEMQELLSNVKQLIDKNDEVTKSIAV